MIMFENPEIEVVRFECDDIVTTSTEFDPFPHSDPHNLLELRDEE